jgi:hypothetical protein
LLAISHQFGGGDEGKGNHPSLLEMHGHFALGKGFAECHTRQKVHDKNFVDKDLFAECLLSGTRQAKKSCHDGARHVNACFGECPSAGHSAKNFFIFLKICQVSLYMALGKEKKY